MKNIPKITFDVNNIDKIPPMMRLNTAWVLWRLEKRGNKLTKPPYRPNGSPASVTNTDHYSTIDQVIAGFRTGKFAGVGYVIRPGSGEVWIDLDHVRNPDTGEIIPWAADIIKAAKSYTEISPSGDGVHIGLSGTIPESAKFTAARDGESHAEIYNGGRYFTVTGATLNGSPPSLWRISKQSTSHIDISRIESCYLNSN